VIVPQGAGMGTERRNGVRPDPRLPVVGRDGSADAVQRSLLFGKPGPGRRERWKAIVPAPVPRRTRKPTAVPSRRFGSDQPAHLSRFRGRRPRPLRGIRGEESRGTTFGGQPERLPLQGLCPILWCVQPRKHHFIGFFLVASKISQIMTYTRQCQDRQTESLTKRENGRIINGSKMRDEPGRRHDRLT
jgi:hypothetical protein